MKKNILSTTLGLGILIFALNANSQEVPVDYTYQCSDGGLITLTVKNLEGQNEGGKAEVVLNLPRNRQDFVALLTKENSPLYSVDHYQLFKDETNVGELKIVTHQFIGRGGCGRAGCNHQIDQVQAQIKVGTYEATFDCH